MRITDAMVGQTVAVFVGIEVKSATGRESESQSSFLERLKKDGALAGTARSVEEAVAIVTRLEK